jgi:hypothetical protein
LISFDKYHLIVACRKDKDEVAVSKALKQLKISLTPLYEKVNNCNMLKNFRGRITK